jgi:hypothetical protein
VAVEWLLSEIEIFGPELFLRLKPEAAREVARALKAMAEGGEDNGSVSGEGG